MGIKVHCFSRIEFDTLVLDRGRYCGYVSQDCRCTSQQWDIDNGPRQMRGPLCREIRIWKELVTNPYHGDRRNLITDQRGAAHSRIIRKGPAEHALKIDHPSFYRRAYDQTNEVNVWPRIETSRRYIVLRLTVDHAIADEITGLRGRAPDREAIIRIRRVPSPRDGSLSEQRRRVRPEPSRLRRAHGR